MRTAGIFWVLIATAWSAAAGPDRPVRDQPACRQDIREVAEGDALFRAGRYAEAQAKFESVLSESESDHRSRSDPETAACLMNQIALALQYQSRTALAVPRFQGALLQFQGKLSPALESRVTGNLAIAYCELGDLDNAEKWARRAVRLAQAASGESHPETLISLSTLASVHYQRGEFARAEPILRRALFVFEKAWGVDAYEVAIAAINLADVYRAQGRHREAIDLYRKGLSGFAKNLPRATFDIPPSQASLMIALFAGGKEREAEELLESVLESVEKLVGPQHPAFAVVLLYAAEMRFRQRRYGSAKQFLEQALDILERFYGPDASESRHYLEAYSAVLHAMKNRIQARQIDERIRKLSARSQ